MLIFFELLYVRFAGVPEFERLICKRFFLYQIFWNFLRATHSVPFVTVFRAFHFAEKVVFK